MSLDAKDFSLPLNQIKEQCPELLQWLNSSNKIDLGNTKALYYYNKCLFKILDGIELDMNIQDDSDNNLIPTAGLRRAITSIIVSEIHPTKVVEIGTGASAIMSLLLARNNIQVIATEINLNSLQSAFKQVKINNLEKYITLVESNGGILDYLTEYFPVDCILSLPPYYADESRQLPKKKKGFRGIDSELYSFGEDIGFSLQLLREWFELNSSTFLIILWKNLESLENALEKIEELPIKNRIIEIKAGTRKRFLTITQKE